MGTQASWRHAAALALCGSTLLQLPGCGSLPQAPTASPPSASASTPDAPLALQGQLSIKLSAFGDLPAKGISLGFFFDGHPQAGTLALLTPMGSQVAEVSWSPRGASLRQATGTSTEETTYGDVEELSARTLGEALPLHTLIHWMQGRPDPERRFEPSATPGVFTQGGWVVDTRERPNHRLSVRREAAPFVRGVQITVRLDP
ncbi:MAG: outer membrane lipoprotein LolB [Burkholderiales bacterium]|nr:outer membrane lipoprotein LolB [Burkholderiales bacterium]MBH2017477.1 outer membrane lipoprotein LolB [Burkholderiales bacterium]